MIRDVIDLRIYQLALKLLKPLSELAKKIPDRELRFQLMDAGKGVAPQIHEGFSKKKSVREFKRYLSIAMGSSDEAVTHLREAEILYCDCFGPDEIKQLIEEYKSLSKQINRTIQSWS